MANILDNLIILNNQFKNEYFIRNIKLSIFSPTFLVIKITKLYFTLANALCIYKNQYVSF